MGLLWVGGLIYAFMGDTISRGIPENEIIHTGLLYLLIDLNSQPNFIRIAAKNDLFLFRIFWKLSS